MLERFRYWSKRLSQNSVLRTTLGFFGFLLTAAWFMLHLEHTAQPDSFETFLHSLWYSFVTVTTTGYGDMFPKTMPGRAVAVVIMGSGIIYAAIFTGIITTWLVERSRKKLLGQNPLVKLEGRFLVCGWKSDMADLLRDILVLHQKKSDYLVLINDKDPNKVNELRQDPALADFFFYRGDDTNPEHLEHACASKASKVLVLADQKPNKSPEEVDFQSVLTCMAMDRINPEIYLITEILLPKFRLYLQNSKVEEVVLSSFNERALLCNMALMSGIYNLFQVLFDIHHGSLDIQALDQHEVGRNYQDVKVHFDDVLVIGVLENMGNLTKRKQERLRQVQKSPKIADAIQGLKEIKQMASNVPVLHPPPNYKIKQNAALIVLKTPDRGLNKVIEGYHKDAGIALEGKRLIASNLQETLLQAASWREYFGLLATNSIELIVEQGHITSMQCGRESYLLNELGLEDDLKEAICQAYLSDIFMDPDEPVPMYADPQEFLARHKTQVSSAALEADRKGHLFILGWKPELPEMLHFLVVQQFINPSVEWKEITLVAELKENDLKALEKQFSNFGNIKIIKGDIVDPEVLKRSRIELATKVLILAETASGRSFEEIDAQTVLAAMMLSDFNKRAYKVAEILDKRYESALRQSKVEEIIALDEFSRRLLALGSHGKGITNVLKEFINLERTVISFVDVAAHFVGETMANLYHAHCVPGMLVIGLLEEAGNMYVRKSEKIRQAQFNPGIQKAVEELAMVKQLNPNQVLLAPDPNHVVQANSRIILLHSSDHRGWESFMETLP